MNRGDLSGRWGIKKILTGILKIATSKSFRILKFSTEEAACISEHLERLRFKDAEIDLQGVDIQCSSSTFIVDPQKSGFIIEADYTCHLTRHPLDHSVIRCISRVAERERLGPNSETETQVGEKRKSEQEDFSSYLCSGLDAYLTAEPCAM